ncbi:Inherit from COG: Na H antiporter [Seminavis robusta]|uniref:Inherit from COG: Na H antiporter n=1 Tax=Seminavis robusta TaxID=568900 RepID=A0A9N8E7Y3_9STRA|nr:Inherit from COG: Na H antiporter [Seminavis robusta]|eukprot:Sro719_g192330.1 Inherit from COG: Na H antiporter (820) ;mRNA; f:23300-26382
MLIIKLLGALLLLASTSQGFDYTLSSDSAFEISTTDVATDIGDLKVLFNGDSVYVHVSGLEWVETDNNDTEAVLFYETSVDGKVSSIGSYDLNTFGRQLPDKLDVGNLTVTNSGAHTVVVRLFAPNNFDLTTERTYQSYAAGVSIIPLIVVLVLAMGTQMVEFSLFVTIFIGACMVTGGIKEGFQTTLDTYILMNLADVDHAYVYLFSLFLSGLVSMMQKSGGMIGFTQWVAQYAKTPRAAQVSIFCVTLLCFFDDYTNLLLTGQSMSSLSDLMMVSKEKFTFLVDATAAPLASLTPVSSWVGFEVNLIQTELTKLIEIYGEENLTVSTSAIQVFLQSIKYRYYPIFMLFLIPTLLVLQRDFGPMLLAERRVRVHERTDGGKGHIERAEGDEGMKTENDPRTDIPYRTFNMLVPVLLLIFFIFFLMIRTGDDGSGSQSFTEKIESSDSFSALLWGTMATAIITGLMYALQIVQNGHYVLPTLPVLKSCLCGVSETEVVVEEDNLEKPSADGDVGEDEGEEMYKGESLALLPEMGRARSLMSIYESVESFLFGMNRLFPALIVLTLAWATGDIMTTVGADSVAPEAMPTLAFVIAVIMALATGSSWSTMTILFPLIMVPTYRVAEGDELIFYATVAGVLSGSVAGDHMSPISDTTVISAMSCGCKLLNHVVTQAPYSTVIVIFCILFGTIPIGRNAMPNIVGILLALVAIILWVFFVGAPIVSPTGRYDILTELFLKCRPNPGLQELREETIKYHEDKFGGDMDMGDGDEPEQEGKGEGNDAPEEQEEEPNKEEEDDPEKEEVPMDDNSLKNSHLTTVSA